MGGKEHFSVKYDGRFLCFFLVTKLQFCPDVREPLGSLGSLPGPGLFFISRRASHSNSLLGCDWFRCENTVQLWPISCKGKSGGKLLTRFYSFLKKAILFLLWMLLYEDYDA